MTWCDLSKTSVKVTFHRGLLFVLFIGHGVAASSNLLRVSSKKGLYISYIRVRVRVSCVT